MAFVRPLRPRQGSNCKRQRMNKRLDCPGCRARGQAHPFWCESWWIASERVKLLFNLDEKLP